MSVLFDTNILVAAAVSDHDDRGVALAALEATPLAMIAIHTLSEVYNTMTRSRPYARKPKTVREVVRSFASTFQVVELSVDQHLAAIDQFAQLGGTGPRLYDFLIGTVARRAGAGKIVTLDVGGFALFDDALIILTPTQYLETL